MLATFPFSRVNFKVLGIIEKCNETENLSFWPGFHMLCHICHTLKYNGLEDVI